MCAYNGPVHVARAYIALVHRPDILQSAEAIVIKNNINLDIVC